MAADFQEVKVVLRSANGSQHAWMAEVDASSPREQLLPDLVEALSLEGEAEDYELQTEGTIKEPVLVLTEKARRRVGRVRDIGIENG